MTKDDNNAEANMPDTEILPAIGGIRFFGKMTASATHEMKNALAIINESAGLLEDLSLMTQKGQPISSGRIHDISKRVARQVTRTDLILKKLNIFSHTADQETEIADLEKTVYLVMDIASRLIEQQEIIIEVTPPQFPLLVETSLFYLENLIWTAIETMCHQSKGKNRLNIFFGPDSTVPSIWFSMETANDNLMDDLLGSRDNKALMAYLDISIENNNNSFGLIWPKQS